MASKLVAISDTTDVVVSRTAKYPDTDTARISLRSPSPIGKGQTGSVADGFTLALSVEQATAFAAVINDPKSLAAALKAGTVSLPLGQRGRTPNVGTSLGSILTAQRAAEREARAAAKAEANPEA